MSDWTPACNCGAYCEDDCVCCPTCWTPQGDETIATNGCNDWQGCGRNRDMDPSIEAKGYSMDDSLCELIQDDLLTYLDGMQNRIRTDVCAIVVRRFKERSEQ